MQASPASHRLHASTSRTKLDDAGLSSLLPLCRLKELLRGCSVSDRGVCCCASLTRLEVLSLRTCEVGDTAAEALGQSLHRLRELDLGYTDLTDVGLAALRPLHRLQLSVDSCRLSAAGLSCLIDFQRMRSLDLSDVEAPGFRVEVLTKLPHLTSLNLFYVGIGDHEVGPLARLTKLTELNLDSRFITDSAMPAIASIPSLTRLDVFGARLTDFGVRFLRKLHKLRHIEICGGGLGDEGVSVLSTLSELRVVNVSQNGGVTDRSADLLTALPVLQSLNLSNTSVTPAAVPSLQQISSLTSLALHSCEGMTKQSAAALRLGLPRLLTLGVDV